MKDLNMLLSILNFNRSAGNAGEAMCIQQYLDPIFGMQEDGYGNRWIEVLHPDGTRPTTLFSSHTDTVHNPSSNLYSKIAYDEENNHILSGDDDCLGADDGAGMYLMIQMIQEGVPGYYIFHREEEVGGGGSMYASKHHDTNHIERAVAFDRMNYGDVITSQFCGTCASKEFAAALAGELEKTIPSKWHAETGSFTDTANYADIIPECTNLSVGYFNQHTKREYLDIDFLEMMEDAVMGVDWEALPTVRDPMKSSYWDDDWDDYAPKPYDGPKYSQEDWYQLVDVIQRFPEAAADILYDMNVSPEEIMQEANAY